MKTTFAEDGKWNFYILENEDGEYDVYFGKKHWKTYKSIDGCKRGIRRNFVQDENGNGLIKEGDYNIIFI